MEGSITVVATDLTKTQVQVAAKTSLAAHFGVAKNRITATATESRRLGVDGNDRRLTGTWTIAYVLMATPAEVSAVNTKVASATSNPTAFKAALATKFTAALKTAGVSDTVANAIQVSAATAVRPSTTTTTGSTTSVTSGTIHSMTRWSALLLSFMIAHVAV